jgi:predicted RNase H-like nuclease (RuvC/YqgF family)
MRNWKKEYFGWLNLKDGEEVEWAVNYLTSRNIYPSVFVRDRDASFITTLVPDIIENEEKYAGVLDKMKKAHASRERRRDPQKKPVTFNLSKSANKKLTELAGKENTKIGMLESLIEEMDRLRKDCAIQLQAEKERLAERYEAKAQAAGKRATESSLGKENEKLKNELARWKAKASNLDDQFKAALLRMCELELNARIPPHGPVPLSYEDKDEAQKRYLAWLKPGGGINQV